MQPVAVPHATVKWELAGQAPCGPDGPIGNNLAHAERADPTRSRDRTETVVWVQQSGEPVSRLSRAASLALWMNGIETTDDSTVGCWTTWCMVVLTNERGQVLCAGVPEWQGAMPPDRGHGGMAQSLSRWRVSAGSVSRVIAYTVDRFPPEM